MANNQAFGSPIFTRHVIKIQTLKLDMIFREYMHIMALEVNF